MKMQYAIPALVALLGVGAAAKPAAAQSAPAKVGVINLQQAIATTAEGKQGLNELQAKFAPRQAELQTLNKQIQDVQARAQALSNTASDEEKATLQRQYNDLTRSLQRKQQDLQDDANEAQQDLINEIGRKMLDVVSKFAAQNGYAMILDTDLSAQQMPVVIYRADGVDVTDEIVKLYDQTYPVKAASASSGASRPAAPRAAAPRAAAHRP